MLVLVEEEVVVGFPVVVELLEVDEVVPSKHGVCFNSVAQLPSGGPSGLVQEHPEPH